MKKMLSILVLLLSGLSAKSILIPMDMAQNDHLKAYGVAYQAVAWGIKSEWLLNYRGGSFLFDYDDRIVQICEERGVTYEILSASDVASIYATIENSNMNVVPLEKAPKIAVYIPPYAEPWDDAVTLALEYARSGVTVNCIAPGATDTEMTRSLPEEAKQRFVRKIPMGRLAEPEEIAAVHLFLAGGAASYITGQVLFVDGGISVGF